MGLFNRKPKQDKEEFGFPNGFDPVLYTVENPNSNGINLFSSADSDPLSVSVVLACVNIRASLMSTLPIHFFENQNGRQVRIFNHPLAVLFNVEGNRYQTPVELREYLQQSFDLNGNGYAQILRNGKGDVIELLPIYPDSVVPNIDDNGDLRYIYGDVAFEKDEVFHLKGLGGVIEGKSIITLLATQMNIIKNGENFQNYFFTNGATPNFVIESTGKIDPKARESIEKAIKENHSGINARKTLLLSQGLTAKALSLSATDAQVIQSINMSAERLASVFGVPAHLLNLPNIKPSYASSQANSLDFYKYTIRGLASKWESVINKVLLSNSDKQRGIYAKFNMDAILRADLAERFASYQIGITNGVLSPNEARRHENLPPVQGGDKPFKPMNMEYLGDVSGSNPNV